MPDKFTTFDPTNPEFGSLTTNEVRALSNVEFDTIRLCNKFVRPVVNVASVVACVALGLWLVAYTEIGQHHNYIMSGIVTVLFLFILRPILIGFVIALAEVGAETKSHEAITIKHRLLMHDRAGKAFLENMYGAAHAGYNEASDGRVFKIYTGKYDCGGMYLIIYRDPNERIGARIVTSRVPGSLGIAMYKGKDIIESASNKGVTSMGLLYRRASDNGLDMSGVAFDKLFSGDYKGAALIWNPIFALQITGQPYSNGDKVIVGSVTISADKKSLYVIYPDALGDGLTGAHISLEDFTIISSRPMNDIRTPDERDW